MNPMYVVKMCALNKPYIFAMNILYISLMSLAQCTIFDNMYKKICIPVSNEQ